MIRSPRPARRLVFGLVAAAFIVGCGESSTTAGAAAQETSETLGYGTPQYADEATKKLVEDMVAAHGGLERWTAIPSFSYTASMYLTSLPLRNERFPADRRYFDNWRHYRVSLDPRTSRGIVSLPFADGDGLVAGFDGRELWSLPYDLDPPFKDSPQALLFFHYAIIALPWLTQQSDVSLRQLEDAAMPDGDRVYHVVEMAFDPAGRTHAGTYTLYIDPETDRLRGFFNTAPYPVLPGPVFSDDMDAGNPPSIFRFTDEYMDVDGLIVPRHYVTLRQVDDGLQVLGAHLVLEPSVTESIPASGLARPEGATVVRTVPAPDGGA